MSIGKKLRFEVLKRDRFTCTYCGAKSPDVALEVDHVIPRSRGGLDTRDNLTTACLPCNRGKGHSPLVPLETEFTWVCVDGPHDGRRITSDTKGLWAWVLRDGDGGLHVCKDRLRETEPDVFVTQPLGGHPGFCMPVHKPFDFRAAFYPSEELKVIGAYVPEVWRDDFYTLDFPIVWWDNDQIIGELTS